MLVEILKSIIVRLFGAANPSTASSTEQVGVVDKYQVAPTIEDKDIYKYVLDTRNLEISLFWQRSNYFLVLNTGLAIGFLNLKSDIYSFMLALFGFVVSMLWYRVNLGSKYWQSRWEHKLALIERRIAPDLKCFDTTRAITDDDVRNSIWPRSGEKRLFQRHIEQVMLNEKPSVSYNMILLSFCFMFGWVALVFARIDIIFIDNDVIIKHFASFFR